MEISELTKFLYKTSQFGYATGKYKDWVREKDGSTTIFYKNGDWEISDNFFGGEPFGGRLVVFYKNKPVWIMVYYGFIKKGISLSVKKIYKFLQFVLSHAPKEFPLRGPKRYTKNGLIYKNGWQGGIDRYFGKEKIFIGNKQIYRAFYFGGLINLRSG